MWVRIQEKVPDPTGYGFTILVILTNKNEKCLHTGTAYTVLLPEDFFRGKSPPMFGLPSQDFPLCFLTTTKNVEIFTIKNFSYAAKESTKQQRQIYAEQLNGLGLKY